MIWRGRGLARDGLYIMGLGWGGGGGVGGWNLPVLVFFTIEMIRITRTERQARDTPGYLG